MSGLKVCFLVEQVCTLLLGLSLLGLRETKNHCNWLCDLTKRNTKEWMLIDFGYTFLPLRIMTYSIMTFAYIINNINNNNISIYLTCAQISGSFPGPVAGYKGAL